MPVVLGREAVRQDREGDLPGVGLVEIDIERVDADACLRSEPERDGGAAAYAADAGFVGGEFIVGAEDPRRS